MKKKSKSPKEPRVNCRVPKEMLLRIQKVASDNGISDSDVVRIGLNRYLPELEKSKLQPA